MHRRLSVERQRGATPGVPGRNEQAGAAAPKIKENQKVQLTGQVVEIGVTKIEETYKPGLKPEVQAESRLKANRELRFKP